MSCQFRGTVKKVELSLTELKIEIDFKDQVDVFTKDNICFIVKKDKDKSLALNLRDNQTAITCGFDHKFHNFLQYANRNKTLCLFDAELDTKDEKIITKIVGLEFF